MTLTSLTNLVLYWVDDVNADYFTSTQVTAFLNNAQVEVQKMLLRAGENFYTKAVQTTTVVNQTDYVLPSDFLKINNIELITSGTVPNEEIITLDQITLNQRHLVRNNASTPRYFYIHRDRVVLAPIPDKAVTLRMTYSYRVADMSSGTDEPDVPVQYHEYLAVIAALDCFLKDDRQPDILMAKKKMYEDMMKKDQENRIETSSRNIVCLEDAGYEVF
jgi:hypothetical protein